MKWFLELFQDWTGRRWRRLERLCSGCRYQLHQFSAERRIDTATVRAERSQVRFDGDRINVNPNTCEMLFIRLPEEPRPFVRLRLVRLLRGTMGRRLDRFLHQAVEEMMAAPIRPMKDEASVVMFLGRFATLRFEPIRFNG
jgi:hypothetical protein